MEAGTLASLLREALGGDWRLRPLAASGFCATWQARSRAQALFVKVVPAARREVLDAEADGLAALAASGTVRVPAVACCSEGVLALEWLELVPPSAGFGVRLANALAALHAVPPPQAAYGWHRDNFLGSTPQRNTPDSDWARFFASARLGAMLRRLEGRAAPALVHAVEAVMAALPGLMAGADAPRPSLIHGDLWSGNWGMLADGSPVLYDPAMSCSDAEAELAMMELFGAPPAGFAAAYAAASGRKRDVRRTKAYQLYHLLNHAVIFDGDGGVAGANPPYENRALRMALDIL